MAYKIFDAPENLKLNKIAETHKAIYDFIDSRNFVVNRTSLCYVDIN